ncbi:MAG: gluconate 2-dehydrogenase subunit 3 family protein [Solirubrobacteraceae bacterium]
MAGATRRTFVVSGALAVLGLAAPDRVRALIDEVARGEVHRGGGRFLTRSELVTLRAVTARLLPGPPDDPGPGALQVHAAEAIDLLLGAFELDPPLIHAGGPFSGRAGGRRDDFEHFVALDEQAALGWRIRLEGSRGLREREFAGPVVGLQETYQRGLARCDALARGRSGRDFARAPAATRDAVLASREKVVASFVDAALTNSLEALCGPPEYGGNHALAGWRGLHWRGDAQPDGFTAADVMQPDPPRAIVSAFSDDERREILERVAPLLAARRARGA